MSPALNGRFQPSHRLRPAVAANRHSYWPRLADADFDTMEPWFNMFVKVMLLAEARTELWWQHRGAWWHEMSE